MVLYNPWFIEAGRVTCIIITRSTYTHACLAPDIYWKNSMNNHVILKGVDVEVMKVIQLASEVHN